MKITREINGKMVEIELTKNEMWSAYREVEVQSAYEDLDMYIEQEFDDDGEPRPEMDEQDRADIVENYLENKGNEWYAVMRNAVEWIVG